MFNKKILIPSVITVFLFSFYIVQASPNFLSGLNTGTNNTTDDNTGAVGIGTGTTVPNALLHLYQITSGSHNAEFDIQSVAGTNNHWGLYNNRSDNSLRFWAGTSTSDALTILRNGNIGIGTTNPTAELHIVGTQPAINGGSALNALTVTGASGALSGGDGGGILMTTGAAGSSGGIGGAFSVTTGMGTPSGGGGKGGDISMTSGAGGGGGTGGNFTFTSGIGSTVGGGAGSAGGNFVFTAGGGAGGGTGGGTGGGFIFNSGVGAGSGATGAKGGIFSVTTGNGSASGGPSGSGGNVVFTTGNGGSKGGTSAGSGGDIIFSPGIAGSGGGGRAGNVGIGTTAPNAKLTIGTAMSGSTLGSTFITNAGSLGGNTGDTLTLANIGFTSGNVSSLGLRAYRVATGTGWTTSALTLGMDVDSTNNAGGYLSFLNGNIGIGTTTPVKLLHVAGRSLFSDWAYGSTPVSTDIYALATVEYVNGQIGTAGPWKRTAPYIYPTTITDSVGIGTTAPAGTLNINEATGVANGAAQGSLIIDHGNSGGASSVVFRSTVNRGSDYGFIQYQDASTVGGTGESARLIIGTSNDTDDHLLLMPSGNVGIGTTNPGSAKLNVQSVAGGVMAPTALLGGNGGNASLTINSAGVNNYSYQTFAQGDTGKWEMGATGDGNGNFYLNPNIQSGYTNAALFINRNGYVGIGTTAPAKLFHVGGQAQFNSFAYGVTPSSLDPLALTTVEYVNGQIGTASLDSWSLGGNFLADDSTSFGSSNNYDVSFKTNNVERVRILKGGSVGIGTTAPAAKLDVNGSIISKDGGSYPFFTVNNNNYNGWYKLGTFSNSASNSGEVAEIDLRTGGGYNGSRAQRIFGTIKLRWGYPGVIEVSSEFSEGSMGVGYTANADASTVDVYLNLQLGYASAESYKVAMLGQQYITWTDTTKSYIAGTPANVVASGVVLSTANNVGIGTTNPGTKLDISGVAGIGSVLTDVDASILGSTGLIFPSTSQGWAVPDAAVSVTNVGNYGANLILSSRNSGGGPLHERMRIQSDTGNVGIGTTAPGKLLHVGGQAQFNSFAYGVTPSSLDPLALTTVEYVNGQIGTASLDSWSLNGNILANDSTSFGSSNNYDVSFKTNDTERVRILKGGNVGIGTTAPAAKLQVGAGNGSGINIGIPNDSMTIATPLYGEAGRYNINFYGWRDNTWNQIGAKISAIRRNIFQNNNALVQGMDLAFYTNNSSGDSTSNFQDLSTERMRIDYNGNVGIGTTAPGYGLDVLKPNIGIVDSTAASLVLSNEPGYYFEGPNWYYGQGYRLVSTASDNSFMIQQKVPMGPINTRLFIKSDGNVGIGTTAPGKLLHVAGQGKFDSYAYGITPPASELLALTTVEYVNGQIGTASLDSWSLNGNILANDSTSFGSSNNYDVSFKTNDTERVRILKGGNVGIGTTAPAAKLGIVNTFSGTGSSLIGVKSEVALNDSTKQSNEYGGYFVAQGSSVNASYGVRGSGGTVGVYGTSDGTGVYGFGSSVGLSAKSTIGYGVYSDAPKNYFSDNVGIGITNPSAKLNVVGANGGTGAAAPAVLTVIGGTGGSDANTGYAGGAISLTSGSGAGGNYNGGAGGTISITAGVGGGSGGSTGIGGSVIIKSGQTSSGSTASAAGDIKLLAADSLTGGTGGTGRGGNIYFDAGKPGVGVTGNILMSTVNTSGNVGIGTTGPVSKLDVNGDFTVGNTAATYIALRDDESPNGKKYIHANSNNIGFLSGAGSWITRWDDSGNQINSGTITASTFYGGMAAKGGLAAYGANGYTFSGNGGDDDSGMFSPSDGVLVFKTDNAEKVRIFPSGEVGIGTTTVSTYKLNVAGSVGATSFQYNSDRNLKKNIATIQNPLSKILQLRGVTFNWKSNNKASVGLIAQEVEKVFPEIVTESNGTKSVGYGNLVAPLIEAVKEQQKKINNLEARINILESRK